MDKYGVLKQYFGYHSFRGGQEILVDAILAGRDTLGIMPTGAGKSICYQVPAVLLDGITIVISPLISLMKDQVTSLVQSGISSAYINTSLSFQQFRQTIQNAVNGMYRIIYVAPERLLTDEFLSFSKRVRIAMIAVDEAHCISQWGQNFRPSYLKISEFADTLPYRPVISAFTATATEDVKKDIVRILKLDNPQIEVTGFDRENLTFNVLSPQDRYSELKKILKLNRNKNGIIYCSTRKTVDELYRKLESDGYSVAPYHAGMSDEDRAESQDKFLYDKVNLMVATNAFGMGIDKSDIRFVIHYNMPKSLESYYQEAGRAGRDGAPAECTLFYSGQDYITAKYLIDKNDVENDEIDALTAEKIKRLDLKRLNAMMGYCRSTGCLRAFILEYFGEKPDFTDCHNCSVCLGESEITDITVEAQKIMSCIKRMGEKYGTALVCDVLVGKDSKRIKSLGFDSLSTYGIMRGYSEKRIKEITDRLVFMGYVSATDDEFRTLKLCPSAVDILIKHKKLSAKLSVEKPQEIKRRKSNTYKADEELFNKLSALRKSLAKVLSVPAYVIFSDATLTEMSAKKPLTKKEMLEISGVGALKMERYGERFLKLIKENVRQS